MNKYRRTIIGEDEIYSIREVVQSDIKTINTRKVISKVYEEYRKVFTLECGHHLDKAGHEHYKKKVLFYCATCDIEDIGDIDNEH